VLLFIDNLFHQYYIDLYMLTYIIDIQL